jgi:hypothetical protein
MRAFILCLQLPAVFGLFLTIPSHGFAQPRNELEKLIGPNYFDLQASDKPFTVYAEPSDSHNLYLTFNLSDRQEVFCELVDTTGKQIASENFANVFNETHAVHTAGLGKGVYILRVQIGKEYHAVKFYLAS